MGARADRLWMIGGAVGAVLLLALGWFFFISPQRAQTSSLHDQLAETELRQTVLQKRLADLRRQNARMPQYLAQLGRDRQALPAASNLSSFLREVQAAGDTTGVVLKSLLVGAPTQLSAAGKQVYALQISLTVAGTAVHLNRFLVELQQLQPRAMLISSANEAPADQTGSLAGSVTLTLSLQVFLAPAKATAPSTTTATTTGTS
jgi:type IV pilus assembly protein PilO